MDKPIVFIILHYQSYKDTIRCVNSIISQYDSQIVDVVVVDNGSNNDSCKILECEYMHMTNVKIYRSERNLGFAKGHNLGISYARCNNYDFYILLNNDTEIIGSNWVPIINKKYSQYSFDVLGPDIISDNGRNHTNPVDRQLNSVSDLKRMIHTKKVRYIKNYLYIEPLIRSMKRFVKYMIRYEGKALKKKDFDVRDVQLQGSCFIFSRKYIDKYSGLYDKTFLYFEEAILRYIADRDNLLMVYTPEISLIHNEQGATKTALRNERKRRLFYLKHSLNSCYVLQALIENDRKEN